MGQVVQKMLRVRMERELSPRICTFKKLLGELDFWKKNNREQKQRLAENDLRVYHKSQDS